MVTPGAAARAARLFSASVWTGAKPYPPRTLALAIAGVVGRVTAVWEEGSNSAFRLWVLPLREPSWSS
jgi:hypothetical protein